MQNNYIITQLDLQNTSELQLTNNRSYNGKADETGILYQDLSGIKRNIDESFGMIEYEASHNQMKSNFKINDHEDLSRLNNRKDTEIPSFDVNSQRVNNFLNDLDKSPRVQSIIPQKIEKQDGQTSQSQINSQKQIQQQKKKDLKSNDDDDKFQTNASSNQQYRDLINQQSNYVPIDSTKQQSSYQKGFLNSEIIKNDGESNQASSHNNLKLANSYRKNLNSEMSLNEKSPQNENTGNFLDVNQSKGKLVPPTLNDSFQMSGGQDTFRPNCSSQNNNIQNSFSKSKGLIQDFQSKTVGTKKDLNALLSNSRKIKLISKIKAKFCAFLGNNTVNGRTRQLNNHIKSQINDSLDLGHAIQHKKMHSIFLRIIEFFVEKLIHITKLDKLPLFDPENPVKIICNTIIVAYNCFFLYWMSIEVFFNAHVGDIGHYLGYTAQACWVTEMLIQMNTCLYHDNEYITDRKEIMVIYFEEYLFFEVVPLIFEGRKSTNITANIFLHLPLLLKFKGMKFYVLQILKNHYFLQLFKLVMLLFFLAHIEACLYNVVGEVESNILQRDTNWIKENPINDGHWYNTYLTALFWAFSVMMNTSTKPTTEIEIVFTCLCMLFSCVFFGYTLNMIGNILMDIERQQKDYKRDLNVLNQFMKRKNLSLSYRRQANISLQNFYTHNREKIKQEDEVIQKINPQLVQEILVAANKNILSKYALFQEQFSQETLEKIYINLEEETYAPRQIIIGKNANVEQQNIYFIASGKVNVYLNAEKRDIQLSSKNRQQKAKTKEKIYVKPPIQSQKNAVDQEQTTFEKKDSFDIVVNRYKKIINTLEKGDFFGQYGFFTGMENDHMVQSAYFTTVMKLKRSRFIEILKENPQEYERFCEIKDKMSNEKEDNLFLCQLCDSNDHQTLECNKTFYNKLNPNFFFKNNHSIQQQRDSQHTRRIKRANKTIIIIHKLLDVFNKIYEDEYLNFLIEQYCEDLDQLQYSDTEEAEEEGELSDSLSIEKSIEFEIENYDNLSQNTTHKSGKSNIKSHINNGKDEVSKDEKHESLNLKQQMSSPHINMMHASHNILSNYCDLVESPANKKKNISGNVSDEKNHFDFEQRNQLDINPSNARSMISHSNRKLSAAKKSTFLSEQQSFNTKEFDDHLNRMQDFMHNPNHLIQQNDQQLNELLNQNINKFKYLQDKYRSLYAHYVQAKRQIKGMKSENPAKQGFTNAQRRETTMMMMSNADYQMLTSIENDPLRKLTQGSPPVKSKFQEETNGIYSNQSNQIFNQMNKESMVEIEGGGSKRYIQHKGTIIMDALAQIQNFMWTFDKMKNYTKYFVENNVEKMIRKTNVITLRNLRKLNLGKKKENPKMKQLVSIKSDGKSPGNVKSTKQFEKQQSKFKINKSKEQSTNNKNK